jgi:hypothetical protein
VRFLEEENRDANKTLKAQREFDEFLESTQKKCAQ